MGEAEEPLLDRLAAEREVVPCACCGAEETVKSATGEAICLHCRAPDLHSKTETGIREEYHRFTGVDVAGGYGRYLAERPALMNFFLHTAGPLHVWRLMRVRELFDCSGRFQREGAKCVHALAEPYVNDLYTDPSPEEKAYRCHYCKQDHRKTSAIGQAHIWFQSADEAREARETDEVFYGSDRRADLIRDRERHYWEIKIAAARVELETAIRRRDELEVNPDG